MYGPGDEVTYLDGKKAVIDKCIGGDDHIIRFDDGSRLAVPARHLTANVARKAEAPADLVVKTATPPEIPVTITDKGDVIETELPVDPLAEVFPTGTLPTPSINDGPPASNAGAVDDAAPAATP